MTANSEQFDSLKNKLQKLQALAERGYNGEAENAKRAIERICQQYGIRMEDVLDIETKHRYTFEIGRKKDMVSLFLRCLSAICDTTGMKYTQLTRSSIRIELTALQYADVLSLFNWHKANYQQEYEEFKRTFMGAYVSKHDLYFDKERGGKDVSELTLEDIERIRRMWKMQDAMSNNTYHKQLEGV
jgi:hypothetical protein|nr:MAG TPA: Protein of unknown function (DUF2786) [Caudoviricetes sp.]